MVGNQPTILLSGNTSSELALDLYQKSSISYSKFFKMDILSRVAFLSAELLSPYEARDKESIATVISTASGCIEVDKKFEESRQTLASPALFVYTLPNIMLGEICIRQGFKGEQICTIEALANYNMMHFQVTDLTQHRGTSACLCGHVEATEQGISVQMLWVSQEQETEMALPFTLDNLQKIFTV